MPDLNFTVTRPGLVFLEQPKKMISQKIIQPELQKKLFQPKEKWFENYLESKLNDIWEKKELQQLKPSLTSTNSKNFGKFLFYKDNNIVPPFVRI